MGKIEKVVFLDTETTGLDPVMDRIVEIAAVHVDIKSWEVIDAFESLVYLDPTNFEIWEPSRFDYTKIESAPQLPDVLCQLGPMLEGATIAGCNPHFDLRFMRAAYARTGLAMPELDYHTIDVGSMVIPLVFAGVLESQSLRSARIWAGREGDQLHRAMPDVLDTIAVCRKSCETMWTGIASEAAFNAARTPMDPAELWKGDPRL